MRRWWDCSGRWGWLPYESARIRGEDVAYGMKHAYFVGPGRFNAKRAIKGSMLRGGE